VRVRPRRGPTRSASEVARSRLRDLPRSRLRGLLHVSAFSLTFHSPPITAVIFYNDQSVVELEFRGYFASEDTHMHIREHMHIGALRAHPLCSADPCRVSSTIPPPRSPIPPPLVLVAVPLPPTVSRPSVRFSRIACAPTRSASLRSTSSSDTKTAGPLWFAQRTCGTTRRPANLQPTSLAGTAERAIRRSPASCARCPSNTSSPSAGRSEKTPTAGRQVSFFCLPIYFSSSAVTFSFVLTFRLCAIPCRCYQ